MEAKTFRWKRKSFFNYDLDNKNQVVIKKEKHDFSEGELGKKYPAYNGVKSEMDMIFDSSFDFFNEDLNGFPDTSARGSVPERTDEPNYHGVRENVKSDKIMKLLMFKNKRNSSGTGSNDAKMKQRINDFSHKGSLTQVARPSLNPNSNRMSSESMLDSYNSNSVTYNKPPPVVSPVKTPSQKRREANPETIRGTAKAKLSATVNKKFIDEDGNFRCTLCPYISKYITHFEMHMKHSHPGVPIFLCEICGFETKAKNYLTVHVMNHLGLKPYKCSECDYASPRKEYLDLHLKRHFKVYCFKCVHCPYTTYRQDYLARHVSEKH